jgi:hypothetical protein
MVRLCVCYSALSGALDTPALQLFPLQQQVVKRSAVQTGNKVPKTPQE